METMGNVGQEAGEWGGQACIAGGSLDAEERQERGQGNSPGERC